VLAATERARPDGLEPLGQRVYGGLVRRAPELPGRERGAQRLEQERRVPGGVQLVARQLDRSGRVPLESIGAIQNWLDNLPPPAYPYAIDGALAAQGEQVFAQACASCHAEGGARLWDVIPLDEVWTDPNRVTTVTQEAIDAMNSLSGNGWAFDGFRKTDGYLAAPLDGIWLRAPYLHNGSVPSLRALLSPPADRPAMFYRGNDTYDQVDVGFVSTVPSEGTQAYMRFEASRDRQRQRWPPVRHRPVRARSRRPARVHEDAVTASPPDRAGGQVLPHHPPR